MAYITFQPKDHFNTVLYTGNGSTQAVTGVGFQPDMVWSKNRNQTFNHQINDAVRGVNKQIATNNSNAQETNTGELTAFGSDGFTVGSGGTLNGNGDGIVSWNWKAGGAGSSNTDGTVTSGATVSANTTAGFSIGTATMNSSGTWTVGHGLGVAPAVVLVKATGGTSNWWMWHQSLGDKSGDEYIWLNSTAISPANDSTAFIITRRTSGATGDWQLYDNKRTPFNVADTILFPNGNTADSQASGYSMDILSNGFKIRTDNSNKNNSGSDFIFLAFAEEPLVSSNNVPATAR
jgi:hypothetical protein